MERLRSLSTRREPTMPRRVVSYGRPGLRAKLIREKSDRFICEFVKLSIAVPGTTIVVTGADFLRQQQPLFLGVVHPTATPSIEIRMAQHVSGRIGLTSYT